VNHDAVDLMRECLKRGSAKLPMPCKIVIEKVKLEEAKIVD
jgi:ribosomal protein L16/L10AE